MHVDSLSLASRNTDFAFSLYKKLASKTPDENIIFSPLSISTGLALASLGARNTTLLEILQGLKFNLTETPEEEIHRGFRHLLRTLRQPNSQLYLNVGNALFIQEQLQLLPKFMEDARDLYAAETFSVKFQDPPAAKQLINDFVKKETQGKIPELIESLDPSTMLVLANYVLFKGNGGSGWVWGQRAVDSSLSLQSCLHRGTVNWVMGGECPLPGAHECQSLPCL